MWFKKCYSFYMNSNSKMDRSGLTDGSSCQWLFVATLIHTLKIAYSVIKFSKGPICGCI